MLSEFEQQMSQLTVEGYIEANATCIACGHKYSSVHDFNDRKVRVLKWHGKPEFICNSCWPDHQRAWKEAERM